MTRVSPPDDARELPGPQVSTKVTCAPRRRRKRADQPPNAPAPTTTTRGARRRLSFGRETSVPRSPRGGFSLSIVRSVFLSRVRLRQTSRILSSLPWRKALSLSVTRSPVRTRPRSASRRETPAGRAAARSRLPAHSRGKSTRRRDVRSRSRPRRSPPPRRSRPPTAALRHERRGAEKKRDDRHVRHGKRRRRHSHPGKSQPLGRGPHEVVEPRRSSPRCCAPPAPGPEARTSRPTGRTCEPAYNPAASLKTELSEPARRKR